MTYLVDEDAAARSRERQAMAERKKEKRREAVKQAKRKQLDKQRQAAPTKPASKPSIAKPSKPKPSKREYKHAIIPYRQGLGAQFYDTIQWQKLRYKAIKLYGKTCHCCGATNVEIHVDHIKPRSKYPELELEINNLQILCRACNLGKGNTDVIDWRITGAITQPAISVNSANPVESGSSTRPERARD